MININNNKVPILKMRPHGGDSDPFKSFEQKLQVHSPEVLENCQELKEFLPKAIEFLTRGSNANVEFWSMDFLQFLRGDPSGDVPGELSELASGISTEVKCDLANLLTAVQSSGMKGAQQAIAELQALNQYLYKCADRQLDDWVQAACNAEQPARQLAVNAIRSLRENNSKSLDLSGLGLTTIPPLPADLISLNLSYNNLTSLGGMPQKMKALKTLQLAYNQLISLVGLTQEMNELLNLELNGNQLVSLVGLPQDMNKLLSLNLMGTQLVSLVGLPQKMNKLQKLDLNGNRLISLVGLSQEMPELQWLFLGCNRLSSLDGLPQNLTKLQRLLLDRNQLISLADLPQGMLALQELILDHNQISLIDLSQGMNALRILSLRGNRITAFDAIPAWIRSNASITLSLEGNPFSPTAILAINQHNQHSLGARIYFDMAAHDLGQRPVEPLGQEVKRWFPDADADAWKPYADSIGGKALATLLMRLRHTSSFNRNNNHDKYVGELKAILELMLKDVAFRTFCFDAVQASDANCHDNVDEIFASLRKAWTDPALRPGGTLEEVIAFQRGLLADTLIEKYVAENVFGGDPLSSGKLLKYHLGKELKLPIVYENPLYGASGTVSNAIETYIKAARQYVMPRLTDERVMAQMVDYQIGGRRTCVEFLRKSCQAMFVAHNLLWVEALNRAQHSDKNEKKNPATKHPSELNPAQALLQEDALPHPKVEKTTELESIADKKVEEHLAMNLGKNEEMIPATKTTKNPSELDTAQALLQGDGLPHPKMEKLTEAEKIAKMDKITELEKIARKKLEEQVVFHAYANPTWTPNEWEDWAVAILMQDKHWIDYLDEHFADATATPRQRTYQALKQALKKGGL